MNTEPDIYDAVAELRARINEPSPLFTVALTVGREPIRFTELTRPQIAELWADIQKMILPQVKLGWFDEKSRWRQLQTKPAKF